MESNTVTDGRRGPAAKNGPAADAAKAAGLVSLEALAEALGEKPGTVRQWNKRRSIPKRAKARLDGLIEKRQGSKK